MATPGAAPAGVVRRQLTFHGDAAEHGAEHTGFPPRGLAHHLSLDVSGSSFPRPMSAATSVASPGRELATATTAATSATASPRAGARTGAVEAGQASPRAQLPLHYPSHQVKDAMSRLDHQLSTLLLQHRRHNDREGAALLLNQRPASASVTSPASASVTTPARAAAWEDSDSGAAVGVGVDAPPSPSVGVSHSPLGRGVHRLGHSHTTGHSGHTSHIPAHTSPRPHARPTTSPGTGHSHSHTHSAFHTSRHQQQAPAVGAGGGAGPEGVQARRSLSSRSRPLSPYLTSATRDTRPASAQVRGSSGGGGGGGGAVGSLAIGAGSGSGRASPDASPLRLPLGTRAGAESLRRGALFAAAGWDGSAAAGGGGGGGGGGAGSRPVSAVTSSVGSPSRAASAGGSRPGSGRLGSSPNPDGGDAAGLGTRWGVSEGGLDGLGWVRNLIRFTESHPVNVPMEDRGGGEVLDPIQGTVSPGLKPNRREDVALLQIWLEDMMEQVQQGALLAGPGASYSAEAAAQVHQALQAGLPGAAPEVAALATAAADTPKKATSQRLQQQDGGKEQGSGLTGSESPRLGSRTASPSASRSASPLRGAASGYDACSDEGASQQGGDSRPASPPMSPHRLASCSMPEDTAAATAAGAAAGTGAGAASVTVGYPGPAVALAPASAFTHALTSGRQGLVSGAGQGGGAGATAGPPSCGVVGEGAVVGPPSAVELADGALHVYGVAFAELKRQVASDCKERGDLLGVLWEHFWLVVSFRDSLLAERRLQELQGEYRAAQAVSEGLRQEIKVLQEQQAMFALEKGSELAAAAAHNRAQTAKLTQAHREIDELGKKCQVVEVTLKEEVERRLEADEKLHDAQEEVQRAQQAKLQAIAQATALEGEVAALRGQVEMLHRELELAQTAAGTAHAISREHLQQRANKEVEMMYVKGQYETDNIVVASLQAQVQALQSQLSQVTGHARFHLDHVGESNERMEGLTDKLRHLTIELALEREARSRSEADRSETARLLSETTASAQETERQLTARVSELEGVVSERPTLVSELKAEARQLKLRLDDVAYRETLRETSAGELSGDLAAIRDQLQDIAGRLFAQGVEGVPSPSDPGWATVGPSSALRKCTTAALKYLESLMNTDQSHTIKIADLTGRLQEEQKAHKAAQQESYQARSAEIAAVLSLQAKEGELSGVATRYRASEDDKAGLQLLLKAAKGDVDKLKADATKLEGIIEHFRPFEARFNESQATCRALEQDLAALQALHDRAKEEIQSLKEGQAFLQKEMDRLVKTNSRLTEKSTLLMAAEDELREMALARDKAQEECVLLQGRMEDALSGAAQALQQLQVSKFLLQEISVNPSLSRPSSAGALPPHAPSASFPPRSASASPPSKSGKQRSGTSQAGQYDVIGVDMPESVERMMSQRGVTESMDCRRLRWLEVKIRIMAYFSARLRGALAAETERRLALEVQLLQQEAQYLTDAKAREEQMATDLVLSLRTMIGQVSFDVRRDVGQLRELLPDVGRLLSLLSASTGFMHGLIGALQERLQAKRDVATQTCAPMEEAWEGILTALMGAGPPPASLAAAPVSSSAPPSPRLSPSQLPGGEGRGESAGAETAAPPGFSPHALPLTPPTLSPDGSSTSLNAPPPGASDPSPSAGGFGAAPHSPTIANQPPTTSRPSTASGTVAIAAPAPAAAAAVVPWDLTPSAPPLPLGAVCETLVRIYLRAEAGAQLLSTFCSPTPASSAAVAVAPLQPPSDESVGSVGGGGPHETVYDAVMSHFQAMSHGAPTASFALQQLQTPDSPLARFLRSCRVHCASTRVATFCAFAGLFRNEGQEPWGPASWQFFLMAVRAVRVLLGATWRSTARQWASAQGVTVPMQTAQDLVLNAFNLQGVKDLEGPAAQRLAALAIPRPGGVMIDLDALLLLLVNEFNTGTCPRNPMLCPRRVADPSGQLPTLGVGASPTLSQSGYLPSTSPSAMGSFPAGTSYDLGSPMGSPRHPGSPGFTPSNRPATAMSSRSGAGGYGAGMAAAGPYVVATRPSTARSGPVSGGWVGGPGQGGGSPRGDAARVHALSGGGGAGGSKTQR